MKRPVDAIVTGFTRNAELCASSFAPLRQLKHEGFIRQIRYVTWSGSDYDAFVEPVSRMLDVETTRIPMPSAYGNARQRTLTYQVRNLEAALACIPGDDTLVLKLRPDFIIDPNFLRSKIANYEMLSAIDDGASAFGASLPRVPFERKVWIPWADANQPFFFEDAAFMGLKRDLALLITKDMEAHLGVLDDPLCGTFVHVLRWASVFKDSFPVFTRYLAEYGGFINDIDYRRTLIPILLDDPFFWHLIVANAWILWTGFHIDCGQPRELLFFANEVNRDSDWSSASALKVMPPYDDLMRWRVASRVGLGLLPAVDCLYGRLTNDAWPRAMFNEPHDDVPMVTRAQISVVLSHYETGVLNSVEDAFYEKLARHHRNWMAQTAAQSA